MGDGAEWIWNLTAFHFPDATQIVDLYHARQHLWDLARSLFPLEEARQKRWVMARQHQLDNGKIENLVRCLRACQTASPQLAEKIRSEAASFRTPSGCATRSSAVRTYSWVPE